MNESNSHASRGEQTQPIGERRLFYFNENGQPAYQVYDLTVDDYLNPQPGDQFFLGELHDQCARNLAGMLNHHYRYSPVASVHIKPKLITTDSTLAQPTPDLVIMNHLSDPQRQRPLLDLGIERAAGGENEVSLRAVFEVTAPQLAEVILETKRTLYQRMGASEYWIIDSGLRPDHDQVRLEIIGYQLRDGLFQSVEAVSERRWESKACRIWLSVSEDRQRFQIGDLRTGTPLPIPAEGEDPAISTEAEASRRAQSIAGQLKL